MSEKTEFAFSLYAAETEMTLLEDVLQVGQVIFPVPEVITSGLDAVTAGTPDALPIVHVGVFEFVSVMPLTEVGVIAPNVSVIAGVVVAVATEPDTPFAVTTETEVTVPVPLAAA